MNENYENAQEKMPENEENKSYWGEEAPDVTDSKNKLGGLRYAASINEVKEGTLGIDYARQHIKVSYSLYEKNLSFPCLFVYAIIKKFQNNQRGHKYFGKAFPTQEKLSEKYGISIEVIRKCVIELNEKGVLNFRKEKKYKPNLQKTVNYYVYDFPILNKKYRSIPFELLDSSAITDREKIFLCSIWDCFYYHHPNCNYYIMKNPHQLAEVKSLSQKTITKYLKILEEKNPFNFLIFKFGAYIELMNDSEENKNRVD